MSDLDRDLIQLIHDLLARRIPFRDFDAGYYRRHFERDESTDIENDHTRFFAEVRERSEWTAQEVDEESRGYGYITVPESSGSQSSDRCTARWMPILFRTSRFLRQDLTQSLAWSRV